MNKQETTEQLIARAKNLSHDICLELDRLQNEIPYGVAQQIGLEKLQSFKSIDEAKEFYRIWLNTDTVERSDATNLHR